MSGFRISRRGIILGSAGLAVAGCSDRFVTAPATRQALSFGERMTYEWQRLIAGQSLAREYSRADLSPIFRANGSRQPTTAIYRDLLAQDFANYRLRVDGLVEQPQAFSLAELRAMPARTQITRHDCVEGWSAIGEWTGVPLAHLLGRARLRPEARYIVFHCADNLAGEEGKGGANAPGQYYESIDLIEAFHPQTIAAYGMNGAALTVPHGAPVRMRIERQLGYKHAKYVLRIEAVASLLALAGGRGGYWPDRGYEWFAGI